ncbi:hypothetical protein WDU94_013520, partial [Cyamophila willieti]
NSSSVNCRPHSEETKVYEDVNKINQASYVRGVFMVAKLNNIPEVMTFFLLFQITEYHFDSLRVFYCSFRVCVILMCLVMTTHVSLSC